MDSGKSIKLVLQAHHRSTSSRSVRLATMTKCTFTTTARQARGASVSTVDDPSTSSGNVGLTLFFNNHHRSTSSRSVGVVFFLQCKDWKTARQVRGASRRHSITLRQAQGGRTYFVFQYSPPLDKLAERHVDIQFPFDKLREVVTKMLLIVIFLLSISVVF